jgi:hypothetical protein
MQAECLQLCNNLLCPHFSIIIVIFEAITTVWANIHIKHATNNQRYTTLAVGSDIAQVISHRLPTAVARFQAQFRSCGICAGQSGTEYFGFPCRFSFDRLLHIHHHHHYHHLSSGACTIGQLVADVRSGLSLTPAQETKKKLTLAIAMASKVTP